MTKIRQLQGVPTKPDADLIEVLEGVLDKAKEGNLRAVGIAGETTMGDAMLVYYFPDKTNGWQLVGLFEALKAALFNWMAEEEE